MSHLALVPFTGLRVREEAMRELGMKLPALRRRASAIAAPPSSRFAHLGRYDAGALDVQLSSE